MAGVAGADRLNQRFVILCEACVPLYPPALIYMQLMHEAKSRVIVHPVLDTEYVAGWRPGFLLAITVLACADI